MLVSLTAAGLGSYVEALVRKHDVEFNVRCPTLYVYFVILSYARLVWHRQVQKVEIIINIWHR